MNRWTTDYPEESGYFWMRKDKFEPIIVEVLIYNREGSISYFDDELSWKFWELQEHDQQQGITREWHGPIEIPNE